MTLAIGNPRRSKAPGVRPSSGVAACRSTAASKFRRRKHYEAAASGDGRTPTAAFTLIELILVMTLLMIVLAVSAPALGSFFKGRNLDSEARRIYALTSYAQSRAVSEGIPMLVWFDSRQKMYGLRAASSYLQVDPKAIEFTLDRDLQMEVRNPQFTSGVLLTPFVDRAVGNVPTIRFRPDGSIAETSPQSIIISQGQTDAIQIGMNTNNVRYEILLGNPYASRR